MDMYQKRRIRAEKKNNDSQKSFSKVPISCLSRIYGDYHLNPYKMGVFKNWDLACFNKKGRKIIKNRLKYTHFWEELGYWLVTCRHILYL